MSYLQSEAVRGSVGRAKGQSDQMWGRGPFETELYMSHMLGLYPADFECRSEHSEYGCESGWG